MSSRPSLLESLAAAERQSLRPDNSVGVINTAADAMAVGYLDAKYTGCGFAVVLGKSSSSTPPFPRLFITPIWLGIRDAAAVDCFAAMCLTDGDRKRCHRRSISVTGGDSSWAERRGRGELEHVLVLSTLPNRAGKTRRAVGSLPGRRLTEGDGS
jgi:hypothetical protein